MKECLENLRSAGYGVMRGVISTQDVDRLRRSIAAAVQQHTTKAMPQGYVGGLLRVNQDIAHFLAHPRIINLCEALFGPHARISAITGTVNGPGVTRGGLHVDWPHNERDESCIHTQLGDTLVHLVTFWMLTDFTAENGGTIVVPGSHRRVLNAHGGAGRTRENHDSEDRLLGSAGDVGLLDARTWHAIAPNLSQGDRVAVIVRYAPWWLNLNPLRCGTRDRRLIVEDRNGRDPYVPSLPFAQFSALPASIQPLVHSMVECDSETESVEGSVPPTSSSWPREGPP
jgi:Phytanoyl-CoA dioxygenase (PhyH)